MAKKIILIDDDETCMFLYRHHLCDIPEMEIVGEFDNAEDALREIPLLRPDVVIVDYTLPRMTGIEFARKLGSNPEIKVLIVTGRDRESIALELQTAHTFEIVRKDWSEPMLKRIRAVCR